MRRRRTHAVPIVAPILQPGQDTAEHPANAGIGEPMGMHERIVYYMRMDRLVKIGTTVNIAGRVLTIMPQGILAIEFGGFQEERERHKMFAEFHSHGEWFWLREPLWAHIMQVRERFLVTEGWSVDDWLARYHARAASLVDL